MEFQDLQQPSEVESRNPNTGHCNLNEVIFDPIVSQSKGRKKLKRLKRSVESLDKIQIKCKRWNIQGYDKRNCTKIQEGFRQAQSGQL